MDAVLLAGGRGTRLAPLTLTVPKPLLPLGERPIIDILITQLAAAGVTRIFVCLGYLAPLMQAFLGDGSRWGLAIEPVIEETPLGTAGGLRLVRGLGEDFFVVNGDTLTDLDFRALAARHRADDAWATLFTPWVDEKIDYGLGSLVGDAPLVMPVSDARVSLERVRFNVVHDAALDVQCAGTCRAFAAPFCGINHVQTSLVPAKALVVVVGD